MQLARYHPSLWLRPFIKEYLVIETATRQQNRLIPAAGLVMALRYNGLVSDVDKNNLLPGAVLSGLQKRPRVLQYEAGTGNLLVVFRPAGLVAFTKQPAHALFGQSVALDDMFKPASVHQLEEQLTAAINDRQRIALTEAFLKTHYSPGSSDLLVVKAIELIQEGSGQLPIRSLAQQLYISQDAFEKRFRRSTGATPRQFTSIIRLRELLEQYEPSRSLTEWALLSGYYDQAHFIRDFQGLTGLSPAAFFKQAYW